MRARSPLAYLAAIAACALGINSHAFAAPQVITMDAAYLEYAKQRIAAEDPGLRPAYAKLMEDAQALLKVAPESVTYKKIVPASGDKHDYMSLAPYWWPDPSKADGLPYIQKDGKFNPSAKNGDSDSVRMQIMCLGTQNLSLAYYFSSDKRYAEKTAAFIRTWFLDPKTRMNPNLRFGQAVMGRVDGRGTGLIDTRNFWMVIDAVALIEPAGILTPAEVSELKAWFKDFGTWMLTSETGIEEYNAFNNHGTYYDMQIANYALFAGDLKTARQAVLRAQDLRIAAQVSAEGKQYAELERTTPFHYSAFNLDAMENLARYGEQLKVDVWKRRDTTRGIKNAINYLAQFAAKPETWPYPELEGKPETELALSVMLRAERAYGGGSYANVVSQLPATRFNTQEIIAMSKLLATEQPTTINSIDRLIWPVLPRKQ